MGFSEENDLFPKSLQEFVASHLKIARLDAKNYVESLDKDICKNALNWLKNHPEAAQSSPRIRSIQEALLESDQRLWKAKRHSLSVWSHLSSFFDELEKTWNAVVNEKRQVNIDDWVETKSCLAKVQKQLKEFLQGFEESQERQKQLLALQEMQANFETELYLNLPVEIEDLRDDPLEEKKLSAIFDFYECGVLTGPLVNDILKLCILNLREPTNALERLQPERLRMLLPLLIKRLETKDLQLVLQERNKAGQTLIEQYFQDLPRKLQEALEKVKADPGSLTLQEA